MKYLFFLLLFIHCLSPLFAQQDSYLPYHKGTKWGVYNLSEDKLIIECKYDSIRKIHNFWNYNSPHQTANYVYFEFQNNKLWGIMNLMGKEIIAPKYDSIVCVQNKQRNVAFLLREGEKWGIADTNGKRIVSCEYDEVFFDDIVRIKKSGKWGAVNYKQYNKQILACEYDYIYGNYLNQFWQNNSYRNNDDSVGYLKVKNKGKISIFTHKGRQIFPFIFDDVTFVAENHFFVSQNKKRKLVDTEQNHLKEEEKEYLRIHNESKEEDWDLVADKKGTYQEVRKFRWGYKAKLKGKWGLLDSKKVPLTPFEYDKINETEDLDFVKVFKGKKFGYLDLSGKVVHECEYEENPDQFTCRKNGKWGVLGTIPFIYDSIYPAFGDNFRVLMVKKDEKFGVYYGAGNYVIECKYDSLLFFDVERGWVWAKENGKWGLVNKKGKIFFPFVYEEVKFKWVPHNSRSYVYLSKRYIPTYIILCQNGKWGAITQNGKSEVLAFEYQNIELLASNNHVLVQQNDLWGIYDLKMQKWVSPCKYDSFECLGQENEGYWAGRGDDSYHFEITNTRKPKTWEATNLKMQENGKWALVYVQEDTLTTTPCQYFSIEEAENIYESDLRLFWVRRGEKWGLVSEGKEYFE